MHPYIEHSFRDAHPVIRWGLSGCLSARAGDCHGNHQKANKAQAIFQEAAKCLTAKVEPHDSKFACENSVLSDFLNSRLSRIRR